jgi:hypothetical protein
VTPIDWREVFSNAVWIFGCALALAVLSYADWRAAQHHEKLRAQFVRPNIRLAFDASLLFICLGLAATSDSTLTVIIWLILAILSIIQTVLDWRTFRRASSGTH